MLPQALVRAVCAAVERVLLQGGPARAFTPACVDRLDEDLGLLQDMLLTVSRGCADFREVLAQEMGRLDKVRGGWAGLLCDDGRPVYAPCVLSAVPWCWRLVCCCRLRDGIAVVA